MNRFKISNDQLLLKTERHNDIVVASDINQAKLLELASDLTALALLHRRVKLTGREFIWASARDREILNFLAKGLNKKQIAERLKITPRSVYRAVARINKRIEALWQEQHQPEPPKITTGVTYQKVYVQNIPFSTIANTDSDDEEVAFDFGDEGEAVAKTWRKLEMDTPIEQTDIYRALGENKKYQELAVLLSQGMTHRQCAKKLGISEQAIHQRAARMRKVLKKCGVYSR